MNNDSYTIKDLPSEERPREKLIKYGVKSLTNIELIAVIIRTGYKDSSALELAKKLVYMDKNGIANLSNLTLEELVEVKGIGECKACQILSSMELGKRVSNWSGQEKIKVSSPGIVANLLMDDMRFLGKEYFKIVLLDTKNQILSIEDISIGTLNASIVHPRDVYNLAIRKNANSIILIHNHPSGDTSPSNEDINVTERLVEIGNLMGIKVLDHLIIGDNKYLSFKEEKLI